MPVQHFRNPRQLPSNNRAIDPARKALEKIVPYQQKKYEAAFYVNPVEIILYSRMLGGLECACTFGDHNAPAAPILGPDGQASPATIQTLLTGSRFGITEYASVMDDATSSQFRSISQNPMTDKHGLDLTTIKKSRNDPNGMYDPVDGLSASNSVIDGLDDETPSDFENNEVESEQLNRSIRSTDNHSCPICFGSGYVGGYNVQNGWRRVIDARESSLTLHNAEIDAVAIPNKFLVTSTGYVEFQIVFPKHVVSIDAFRVMNGKYSSKNSKLSVRLPNSNTLIDPSSSAAIKSFCDGNTRIVRVHSLSPLDGLEFTHVEFQFNLSEQPLLAEFPKFGENTDLNLLDELAEVQINMSSRVVSLHSEDVVFESSMNRIWQVTAAQFYRDHNQNVIGWDCNARVFQPYEVQTILPTRRIARTQHQKNTPPIRMTRK